MHIQEVVELLSASVRYDDDDGNVHWETLDGRELARGYWRETASGLLWGAVWDTQEDVPQQRFVYEGLVELGSEAGFLWHCGISPEELEALRQARMKFVHEHLRQHHRVIEHVPSTGTVIRWKDHTSGSEVAAGYVGYDAFGMYVHKVYVECDCGDRRYLSYRGPKATALLFS